MRCKSLPFIPFIFQWNRTCPAPLPDLEVWKLIGLSGACLQGLRNTTDLLASVLKGTFSTLTQNCLFTQIRVLLAQNHPGPSERCFQDPDYDRLLDISKDDWEIGQTNMD